MADNKSSNLSLKIGLILVLLSPIVAILPWLIALPLQFLLCEQPANEGNCGPAALPWFMFFTIPIGALMLLSGTAISTFFVVKKLFNKSEAPIPDTHEKQNQL